MTAGLSVAAEHSAAAQDRTGPALVAYFSRTGNTRVIATQIRRALGADLFEIAAASPYPEDYEATVKQAERERDRGYEPPLAASVSEIARYQTVFLGFPIWGQTAPPVIRSFLRSHDLTGSGHRPLHHAWGLRDGKQPQGSRACPQLSKITLATK
jgi:flavodoxin